MGNHHRRDLRAARVRVMNFYPRYCGDYMKATGHLSMLEDGAYGRLLDWQYGKERPLPVKEPERLYSIARAITPEQQRAVDKVVAEFFDEDGWNERAREEIEAAQPRIQAARLNGGKNKGKPRTTPSGPRGTTPQGKPPAYPPGEPPGGPADGQRDAAGSSTGNPMGKLTNLHTPEEEKTGEDARAPEDPNFLREFPPDWKPCEMSLAMVRQHALPEPKPEHVAGFVGHWLGKSIAPRRIPGEFLKWMARQKGIDARASVSGTGENSTDAAWSEFRDCITHERMPQDPKLRAVIAKWGGLRNLGLKTSKELDFKRKAFDVEYRSAAA